MQVNRILSEKRVELGLSQKEVADAIGVTLNMYSFIERGLRNCKFTTWKKLKDVLGLTENELFQAMDCNNADKE